jgi:DNA mismatch endonuclease (patch repair protein)
MARANHRSPNYPRLAFDAALEKARIVYDRHHKHSVSREAIAQALGYTSFNNGASKAVIAALKYYGLLEPAGDGLCVSSDAVRALELPQQDPERAAALVRMVFAPPIFADLRSRNGDQLPEIALRSMVHRLGYRFRLHRADLPGKPDLVLASKGAVIMMHGCFWHGHTCKDGRRPGSNGEYWNAKLERNAQRDKKNTAALRGLGWRCLVVWECELKNRALLERRIHRFLGER